MSYQKHLPFSKTDISPSWWDRVERVTKKMLFNLNADLDFFIRETQQYRVYSEVYIPYNHKSIEVMYVPLLTQILDIFEVKGIWKTELNPDDTGDTMITLVLYGCKPDIDHALRLMHYYHRGLNQKRDDFISEYKRLRTNKRRTKKTLGENSKSKANKKIKDKIAKITKILLGDKPSKSVDYRIKLKRIFKKIRDREKLDYRKFRTTNPVLEHAYCSANKIELNRIL